MQADKKKNHVTVALDQKRITLPTLSSLSSAAQPLCSFCSRSFSYFRNTSSST